MINILRVGAGRGRRGGRAWEVIEPEPDRERARVRRARLLSIWRFATDAAEDGRCRWARHVTGGKAGKGPAAPIRKIQLSAGPDSPHHWPRPRRRDDDVPPHHTCARANLLVTCRRAPR